MDKFGDMFGDDPPQSLDDLLERMRQQMAATQSLLSSLSAEQRAQLQSLMSDKFGDPELESELRKLAKEMDFLNPDGTRYKFGGDEELDLEAAMKPDERNAPARRHDRPGAGRRTPRRSRLDRRRTSSRSCSAKTRRTRSTI